MFSEFLKINIIKFKCLCKLPGKQLDMILTTFAFALLHHLAKLNFAEELFCAPRL